MKLRAAIEIQTGMNGGEVCWGGQQRERGGKMKSCIGSQFVLGVKTTPFQLLTKIGQENFWAFENIFAKFKIWQIKLTLVIVWRRIYSRISGPANTAKLFFYVHIWEMYFYAQKCDPRISEMWETIKDKFYPKYWTHACVRWRDIEILKSFLS